MLVKKVADSWIRHQLSRVADSLEEQKSRLKRKYQENPWDPEVLREVSDFTARSGKGLGLDRATERARRDEKYDDLRGAWIALKNILLGEAHPVLEELGLIGDEIRRGGGKSFDSPEYFAHLLKTAQALSKYSRTGKLSLDAILDAVHQSNSSKEMVSEWRSKHPDFRQRGEAADTKLSQLNEEMQRGRGPEVRFQAFIPARQFSVSDFSKQLDLDLYNARNTMRILLGVYYVNGKLEVGPGAYWSYRVFERIEQKIPELEKRVREAVEYHEKNTFPNIDPNRLY